MDAAEDWNLVLWDLADLATRLGRGIEVCPGFVTELLLAAPSTSAANTLAT